MGYVLYQITCAENGKRYVGYTAKTAEARFEQHMQNARWKRKSALYDAVRCYGREAFTVDVLLACDTHAEACEHEIRLIAEIGSLLPHGYNMTTGGDGVPLTPEQIKQANDKKRGRFTEKQREAANRRRGTKASPETRAKLSAARIGKKHSAEHVRRRAENLRRNRANKLGIPFVEKTNKVSEPRGSGKRVWTETQRAKERERALKQWTLEAKLAAKKRAAAQWTPEARQAARDRMNARYARQRAERESA